MLVYVYFIVTSAITIMLVVVIQFSCNNQNQSDYNVGGRLGILLSETGKDTGSYIGIPSTIYEHSNLYTNTVIEIGSAQTFH